jgi:large subunit ribosomal protein L4
MEAITLPIYNTEGKEIDTVKLNSTVFDGVINTDAIYQAVNAYRANQRKGLASTKTRGEVSGGGRKPWKQKGTGRARVGSTRSPLWRHGGVVFGPHPRDFSFNLPQKIKALALRSALNAKIKDKGLIVLDDLKLAGPKTKEASKIFFNLKVADKKRGRNSVLVLVDKMEKNAQMALGNLSFLDLALAIEAHVYQVLSHKKIIITKDGLNTLTNRLKK